MPPKAAKPSLRQRLALNAFAGFRHAQARLHKLDYLFWECTLRCNIACRHCGSDCEADAGVPDMPLNDFLRVLDRIAGMEGTRAIVDRHRTTIVLTGGEPTCRPDLEACGRAFTDRQFPWGMVTNGWALDAARFAKLRAAGLASLTVSLDGLAENHDWLRGRAGSFDRALAAIKLAAAEPEGTLAFDVMTCVHGRNIGELRELRSLLVDAGVKHWRLTAIFAKGRALTEPVLADAGSIFPALVDFIEETRAEGTIHASLSCEGFLGAHEGAARDGLFFCRAGITVGSVLADGGISACPSLRGDYVQGNIYLDDFVDAWENRFAVMRDRSWARTGKCATCASWKWCEGNGLHLRDGTTGVLSRCHLELLADA